MRKRVAFIIDVAWLEERLGICYLSAMLKTYGHEVRLFQTKRRGSVENIVNYDPNVLAYSVITGSQRYYLEVNRSLKRLLNAYSIFGGPHPTFFPEIIHEDGVDVICRGEGEHALVELCDSSSLEEATQIKNLWVKLNGSIYRNEVRPLIQDLDSLPFPSRDLFLSEDASLTATKTRKFITGRGCPFQCNYCFNSKYNSIYKGKGSPVRRRTVDNVIQEILATIEQFPLQRVKFIDDTFNMHIDWLEEFGDKYPTQVGIPFICNVRADLINEKSVSFLKRAGCFAADMGIESGNDRLRNDVLKRGMTREEILKAGHLLKSHHIRILTDNMVGLPSASLGEELETVEINRRIKPEAPLCSVFQPYPGTPLAEYAIENGYFDGDFNKISRDFYFSSPLTFKSALEKNRIVNIQSFFAILVWFPWLQRVVLALAALPPNPLFRWICRICNNYILMRLTPVRYTLWQRITLTVKTLLKSQ